MFAYRQMLADVIENSYNHVIEPLAKYLFFTCRSIRVTLVTLLYSRCSDIAVLDGDQIVYSVSLDRCTLRK